MYSDLPTIDFWSLSILLNTANVLEIVFLAKANFRNKKVKASPVLDKERWGMQF